MGAADTFKAANVIITCSNSYTVSVDGDMSLVKPGDGIVCLPFAMASSTAFLNALAKQKKLVSWLRKHGNEFDILGAISVGVFLLADAALMDGKSASAAWWFESTLKQRHPDIPINTDLLCVKDGNIITSGSVQGYHDLCMEIVERYAGKSFVRSMSRYMMDDYERRSAAPQLFASQIRTNNPIVDRADAFIQRNLNNDIRIDDIAEHISVSPRTLSRYFQSTFSQSPKQYLQAARVEKCKLLLEITELDFSQIAYRCGYNEPGTLRRLFKKHCGISPIEYRTACRK